MLQKTDVLLLLLYLLLYPPPLLPSQGSCLSALCIEGVSVTII